MKVILIEEERFAEITDLMRAKATQLLENGYLKENTGLTDQQIKFAADEMYRGIHFEFVRWAQSHGASCVKR